MMKIKMPSNCVNCTAEEMEYDGCGFDWKKFGEIAGVVVSSAIMIASATLLFKKGFEPNWSPIDAGEINRFGKGMMGTFLGGGVGLVTSVKFLAEDVNN